MAQAHGLGEGIASLNQVAARVANIASSYIQGIKNASTDIKSLYDTTKNLAGVLAILQVYTAPAEDDLDEEKNAFEQLEGPIGDCTKLLERLLERFEDSPAKSGGRRRMKPLVWPLKGRDTSKYLERLAWYTSLFDLALANDMYEVDSKMKAYAELGWQRVDDVYEIVQKPQVTNAEKPDSFSEGMIDWISTVDAEANHRQACSLQQEGTGTWLTESPQFQEWLKPSPEKPFIWLSGMPGAGKTILMSTLIQETTRKAPEKTDAVVYYYFDFKIAEKQTAEGFVRSILKQLVLQTSHLPDIMTELYNKYRYSWKSVPLEEFKEPLASVVSEFNSVSILADAMDECNDWEALSPILLWLTSEGFPNVKIVASSRRKKHISDTLETSRFTEIAIQNEQVDEDIKMYVSELLKTSRFARFPASLKDLIALKLSEGSQGMFRWAKCQIDSLQNCQTPKAVKTVLEALPATLDEYYERIIREIPEENRELARRALLWLIFSKRDLKLEELAEAVTVEPDVFVLNPDAKLLDPSIILEVCGSLVTLQRSQYIGLAHYSVKEYFLSGRATLFDIETLAAEAELARTCLTYLLLDELQQSSDAPREVWPKFDELPFLRYASSYWWKHAVLNEDSVLDLSVRLLTPNRSKRATKMLLVYYERHGPYETWTHWDKGSLGGKVVTPLHLAAHYNLVKTAEVLCREHAVDLNLRADINGSPLYLAAASGHEEIVSLLIRQGADLNNGRGLYGTPLSAACSSGKLGVVKELVEAGADVNGLSAKSRYNHPLIVATLRSGLDVVRYLVEHGSNVNATHSTYTQISGADSPLVAAADSGDWDTFGYLLSLKPVFNVSKVLREIVTSRKYGLDKALRLVLDTTPFVPQDLSEAFCWIGYDGRCDLAEIMLRYGADVNLTYGFMDGRWETPLQRAAENGRLEIVKLLLRHGADVDKCDTDNKTPLQLAAYSGWDLEVFQALLDAGADVNGPARQHGGTLACAAAAPWNYLRRANLPYKDVSLEIFRILLDHGARIEPQDARPGSKTDSESSSEQVPEDGSEASEKGYTTPLIVAAEHGRFEMVEALIKRGVDVNKVATTGHFVTALCAAARYGDYEIVKLLLDAGADPNLVGLNYGTALNAAAKAFCPPTDYAPDYVLNPRAGEVFKLLVDAGAGLDIYHKTPTTENIGSYDSPIVTAAYNKHWDAVNLLLDRGVALSERNVEAMYGAAKGGSLQVVRRMYELGGDPDIFQSNNNLLQMATTNRDCPLELAEYLISKGVSVNPSKKPYRSALYEAVSNRRLDLVKLICQHGPDPKDPGSENACSMAIYCHAWEIERVLRDHGFVTEEEAEEEQAEKGGEKDEGEDGNSTEEGDEDKDHTKEEGEDEDDSEEEAVEEELVEPDNEEWEADETKSDWYARHKERGW